MPDSFTTTSPVAPEDMFIYAYSGQPIGPLYPAPDLEDIAISSGRLCRFAGHGSCFYSLLLHCFVVADLSEKRDKRAGLLHDSSETLINDIPTPFKSPEMKALEKRLLMSIFSVYLTEEEKLDFIEGGYARIKEADQRAFAGEVWCLGNRAHRKKFPDRDLEAEKVVKKYLKKYSLADLLNPNGAAIHDFVRKATK